MEEEIKQTPNPRSKKIKLAILEGFLIFLILVLGVSVYLLSYQKTYAGKIFPNVQFKDLNIGAKTPIEAKTILDNYNKRLLQQKITIVAEDKTTEATFADAGASLAVDQIVKQAYDIGRDTNFLSGVYKTATTLYSTTSVEPVVTTDQQKFQNLVGKISADLSAKAVDAAISINGATVSITPGQKGQAINEKDLIDKILAAIDARSGGKLIAKTTYANPETTETELTLAKTQAESLIKKSISFYTDDQSFSLTTSPTQVASLISFNKNAQGVYSAAIDSQKVSSFVSSSLAKKIDVAKVDRKISSVNQAVLSEGSNGKHLDQTDARNKINAFFAGTSASTSIGLVIVTDTFGDVTVFPDEGIVPGRFPGKYIDVDLTHQQMYLFDGQNQVAQYTVSTGKWSTPTPVGTRYIENKDPRAWSAPYGLYMPWWQSLGGGYGIHELPEWPGGKKEGENHLGTPVSHGCIRLGVGPAEFVYNWTDIGTPVYIHK